ncbi:MAG: hypothetical protein NTZ90_09450 [Proteobacteria bacterium]|nr:hypothetical protein [Pseudomonadota bacterium]
MFIFPLNPADLFHERFDQMRMWGIPVAIIQKMQTMIDDPWREAKGGWTFAWSQQAEAAEARGQWLLASACYAAARFPSACTPYRQAAHAKHVACYLKAAPSFPCHFYGMPGIIGNALRQGRLPDDALVNTMFTGFSLKTLGLLDPGRKIPPLLAINGAQDQYIPRLETEGLRAFPSAEVWLVKGATHCAAEKLPRCIPAVIAWLRVQLHGDTAGNRLALAAGKALLPPLLKAN